MKKASEYRMHARECRALALQLQDGQHKQQLLDMADTWDSLAEEREKKAFKESKVAAAQ